MFRKGGGSPNHNNDNRVVEAFVRARGPRDVFDPLMEFSYNGGDLEHAVIVAG